jgi:hypothetical protein
MAISIVTEATRQVPLASKLYVREGFFSAGDAGLAPGVWLRALIFFTEDRC